MCTRKAHATREAPRRGQRCPTGRPRGTGRAPWGGGEVRVPLKPGNAGGGKGPQFKTNAISGEGPGDWATYRSEECSETAEGVARESEGRSRVSLLRHVRQDQPRGHPGHADAQCRSNKGAPGVDGQEFADIEAYGVQRWLGELALALRQETYRPAPIRRGSYRKPTASSGRWASRPCVIEFCMTAAMLVLEPIFEADLPPEQYAYRPGRKPNRRGRVGALLDLATRKDHCSRRTSTTFATKSARSYDRSRRKLTCQRLDRACRLGAAAPCINQP